MHCLSNKKVWDLWKKIENMILIQREFNMLQMKEKLENIKRVIKTIKSKKRR